MADAEAAGASGREAATEAVRGMLPWEAQAMARKLGFLGIGFFI